MFIGVFSIFLLVGCLNGILAYKEYKTSGGWNLNEELEELDDPTWCYWDGF